MSAGGLLRVTASGGRLDVTIDRPQARNALSLATLRELSAVFTRFAEDPEIKVAVLTGAGDRAFAAGGDLKELIDRRSPEDAAGLYDLGREVLGAVERFPVPVVAALNGVALGGGAELALACDFRLAAAQAKIGFVQAQLGLTTGFGGGVALQTLVGPQRALRLLLQAEVLSAAAARDLGLVDGVAGVDEALATLVESFVAPILQRPAALVRALKAAKLAYIKTFAREDIAALERENFIAAWTSEAHWAAAEALLQGVSRSR